MGCEVAGMSAEPQIRYTTTSDGVAIAYAVAGEGPPMLFARSFLASGIDDEIARKYWRARRRTHSVVLWDPRGAGLSGSAPEAEFDDWLADIDAVADAAGVDRFDLVGQWMGCHLAMAYAARQPDRVNRLALLTPSRPGFSQRRRQPAWLFALASENWHDFVDMLALRIHGWDEADLAKRWSDQIRAHFTSAQFLRLMNVTESIDATGDAGSIRAPTLVVDDRTATAGVEDLVARQRFARELAAAIPGAQLVIIKPGDAPEAQVVERFLSGSSGRAETRAEASTPSGMAVILFTDIVDSTPLTERMGDAAFRTAARKLDEGMRAAIRDAGGTPVEGKVLGDGVMAVFASASQAISAARRCIELSAESELRLHVGLHAGDVIREAGNVYGGAVNIASRVCGLSAPGAVLVSATVRDLARTSAGVTFEDRGEQALKGIDDAVRLYDVHWREEASDTP